MKIVAVTSNLDRKNVDEAFSETEETYGNGFFNKN